MFGFTRNETTVLLFLIFSFIVGIGVWAYRYYLAPLPESQEAFKHRESVIQRKDIQKTGIRGKEEDEGLSIFINDASQSELERLPGIGPVIAERILEYRSKHGKFHTLEALMEVNGIGQKTYEKLKPYLKLQ